MSNIKYKNGSTTTLDNRVEDFRKYFAAKNLAPTHEGIGALEVADDFSANLETLVLYWGGFNNWLKYIHLTPQPFEQGSVITTEPNPEHAFTSTTGISFIILHDPPIEDERTLELISHIENSPEILFSKQLAKRSRFLFDISKEERPSEIAITPGSLDHFFKFLQSQPNLKYPDIVLSPLKNIRAQWRVASNQHFAVEFLPSGETHFVVFFPDKNHSEKISRLTGLVSVDSLMETVESCGVLNWAT
jgi:hypothetical protein